MFNPISISIPLISAKSNNSEESGISDSIIFIQLSLRESSILFNIDTNNVNDSSSLS